MKIYIFNKDWQFPAITEKHAYEKIASLGIRSIDNCYIAFPWATLIDKMKNGKDCKELIDFLSYIETEISKYNYKRVITVCQHIRMIEFSGYLNLAKITDVFWSHKIKGQDCIDSIDIYPFPLFPTNISENEVVKDILFSFVGARSNQWYLTNIRNIILDNIENKRDVIIKGRDSWHYNDVVYKKQIKGESLKHSDITEHDVKSKEYLNILERSKYALCPSGTGPNSIRLWECIEMGVLPVVLANTYEAPSHLTLFSKFAIIIEECIDDVKSIENELRNIKHEEYENRISIMKSYKLLYGRDGFVNDILSLISVDYCHLPLPHYEIESNPELLLTWLSTKALTLDFELSHLKSIYLSGSNQLNLVSSRKKSIFESICKFRGINFDD
ncbi:exostosin family protein [Rheinheimera baltica]|uniref:exostosin domain-containing protein n=1 Tax=Rheinheimera baltica TaxID=67576 RepID=UPI00273DAB98|nr:exostosin family protein [Rheinheimera baltica]MDP5143081.1 exostosin family protein [Rheinheimera baltica]